MVSTGSSSAQVATAVAACAGVVTNGATVASSSTSNNTAQNVVPSRPFGAASSTGRPPLTRSSSSGPGVADSTLSVAPNPYATNPNHQSAYYNSNTATRPASLVTVLTGDSASQVQQATYATPSHQQYMQSAAAQYGANNTQPQSYHLYGTTTAKSNATSPPNSTNNPYHKANGAHYGLPQRFPTTLSQIKSPSVVKLVSTGTPGSHAAAAPPPTIMSSSYHSHYSASSSAQSKVVVQGTGSSSAHSGGQSTTLPHSSPQALTTSAIIANQSSFPRSLFTTSTNIFESKKNKLFGSVSSIDLQCLKESQKVSVIERKSSRIGRSLKSTSSSSSGGSSGNNSVTAPCSATSSSNINGSGSGNSGTGGNGSGGSSGSASATSSFFRLFTSSSSKKMIPFGFSSSSSSSNSSQQSGPSPQSPPTPGGAVPSGFSGSSSSASSSSSTHTITARSDLVNGTDPKRSGLAMAGQPPVDQSKPLRSGMMDSAATSIAATASSTSVVTSPSLSLSTANMIASSSSCSSTNATITSEPIMPSNEILFRKYFTFYDLLSSTNLQRLFELAANNSGTTSSTNSSTSSMSTSSLSVLSGTSGVASIESSSSTTMTQYHQQQQQSHRTNGAVTTFESSTLSSTSSYSSCTSSMSSASHPAVAPSANAIAIGNQSSTQYSTYSSYKSSMATSVTSTNSLAHNALPPPLPASVSDIGNDLLAPSPNFLNEIGSERQYSIELRWNNGSAEEIPAEMLDEQKHNADQSIYDSVLVNGGGLESSKSSSTTTSPSTSNAPPQLHPPSFAKRINIFSDGSPFAALSAHSVMSDLYGSGSLTIGSCAGSKSLVTDFNDLDDGFGSLSSTSLGSTYPNGSSGTVGANGASGATAGGATISRCPFSAAAETCNLLEMDHGTNYYRTHFRDFEHQNWLQIHEKYGPLVVSLRKERVKSSSGNGSGSSSSSSSSSSSCTRWRVIVRTTSLIPLRGTLAALPSICLPGGNPGSCSLDSSATTSRSKGAQGDSFNINSVRDVLSLLMPKNVCVSNFRLGSPTAVSQLLKLDELSQNTEYKIGVLYAYGSQHSEEEFYNNILDYSSSSKDQFYDFMGLIASRVRLKDFKGYKAGLDVLNDTTGEYSWTSRFHHVDIMFHVCPELPFTETNRQQLPRKRHIGNDIVTIVFLQEHFHGPAFTPSLIRSKFQQVFIIVKPLNNGQYFRVAVARHRLVPLFGPPLKQYYTRHELRDFILTKIINAENACHSVNKFAEMAKRTRNEYLVDLCNKHTTTQTVHHVDSSSSSMNSLNSFKKLFGSSSNSSNSDRGSSGDAHTSKRSKHLSANHEFHLVQQDPYLTAGSLVPLTGPPFSSSHILNGIKDPPTLLGGILFGERCAGSSVPSKMYVHDFSTSRDIEASLLLSNEAIMVIDATTSEVIWAAPVTSIIGWTDSSGVFATSPTTSPGANDKQMNGSSNCRSGPMRAKSVDCELPSPVSNSNYCGRQLRLYYHQGECIQIMQRPTGAAAPLPSIPEPSPSTTSKSGRHNSHPSAVATYSRNDDPFLHLIRILELITRKSELRELVIKRKTSPVHKPQTFNQQTNTNNHSSNPNQLPFDLLGRCGGQFGFSLSLSTGIIEDIIDEKLSCNQLAPGCKVVEIAKISFAAMAPEELQDLLNASVLICLTYTEFDFVRYQPRCSCPWPQALQLLQRQKSQLTPPSEYENLPLAPKMPSSYSATQSTSNHSSPTKQPRSHLPNGSSPSTSTSTSGQPGVKSIHITHNQNSSHANLPQSSSTVDASSLTNHQPSPAQPQALMNVSSTSSTSSYYSTNNSNSQNQSPSHYATTTGGHYQSSGHGSGSTLLYQAKSASNLSQYNHGYGSYQSSPVKSATSSAISATNSPANGGTSVVRSKSSTLNTGNGSTSFKDNLIRLITMDDCGLSPTGSSHSATHSPGINGDLGADVTSSEPSNDSHQTSISTTQLSLVSNYHPNSNYYASTTATTAGGGSRGGSVPGHVQPTSTNSPYGYSTRGYNHNQQVDIVDPYSSYPSSRYSTASSTQYSSLGRNAALAGAGSTTTQIQLNNSVSGPIISGAMRPMVPNSVIVDPSNDCYLLTAQPVRVDSNSSSSSATLATSASSRHDLHGSSTANLMTASLDSASAASLMSSSISSNTCNSTASSTAMFNSLMSSSTSGTSASDTIADIVWPSMHQVGGAVGAVAPGGTVGPQGGGGNTIAMSDSPPSSLMIHTPLNRAALVGNEIVVTGQEQIGGNVPGVVADIHLTDEVRKLSIEKDVLHDTIQRLREENQRLHQESQNASQQLRKLTEWFFNGSSSSNTTNSGSSSSNTSANGNGTPTASTSSNTTTISIQQSQQQQQPGSSNNV